MDCAAGSPTQRSRSQQRCRNELRAQNVVAVDQRDRCRPRVNADLDGATWSLVEDLATGRLDAKDDAYGIFERIDDLLPDVATSEQVVFRLALLGAELLEVLAHVRGVSIEEVIRLVHEARGGSSTE